MTITDRKELIDTLLNAYLLKGEFRLYGGAVRRWLVDPESLYDPKGTFDLDLLGNVSGSAGDNFVPGYNQKERYDFASFDFPFEVSFRKGARWFDGTFLENYGTRPVTFTNKSASIDVDFVEETRCLNDRHNIDFIDADINGFYLVRKKEIDPKAHWSENVDLGYFGTDEEKDRALQNLRAKKFEFLLSSPLVKEIESVDLDDPKCSADFQISRFVSRSSIRFGFGKRKLSNPEKLSAIVRYAKLLNGGWTPVKEQDFLEGALVQEGEKWCIRLDCGHIIDPHDFMGLISIGRREIYLNCSQCKTD